MRTLIDITKLQVQSLEDIAKAENLSRAAIIRAAIDEYIMRRHRKESDEAFGLWSGSGIDGLAFQEKVRDEW
ncbi:ribbon-helix-helix protein, CopG family [Pararhizobium sp. O133]|uniref:ribbon-helix-helix protein, CopG family n=1 Tax=Pararhizobium sp. O133 TaxID=3449278 RepID=UPI003F684F27